MKRWRHKKRGTTYTEIGRGTFQYTGDISNNAPIVIYQSDADGSLWSRLETEFEDGRFEKIEAAPAEYRETIELTKNWGLQKLGEGDPKRPRWALTFMSMQWHAISEFLACGENGAPTLDGDMRKFAEEVQATVPSALDHALRTFNAMMERWLDQGGDTRLRLFTPLQGWQAVVNIMAATERAAAQSSPVTDGLLPCPFCGNELYRSPRNHNPKAYCVTEECYGKRMSVVNLDDPIIVAMWNARAPQSFPPAQTRQEPVEWHWRVLEDNGHPASKWFVVDGDVEEFKRDMASDPYEIRPLYTAPAQSLLDREAIARIVDPELYAKWDRKRAVDTKADKWFEATHPDELAAARAKADAILALAPAQGSPNPADEIIGQIEERFPDWKGFRDLVDCIDVTLHRLRGGR